MPPIRIDREPSAVRAERPGLIDEMRILAVRAAAQIKTVAETATEDSSRFQRIVARGAHALGRLFDDVDDAAENESYWQAVSAGRSAINRYNRY